MSNLCRKSRHLYGDAKISQQKTYNRDTSGAFRLHQSFGLCQDSLCCECMLGKESRVCLNRGINAREQCGIETLQEKICVRKVGLANNGPELMSSSLWSETVLTIVWGLSLRG